MRLYFQPIKNIIMAAEKSNLVKINLSRAILHLDAQGNDTHLKKGVNVVSKEIAEHHFVKAHITDADDVSESATEKALREMTARAEAAEKKAFELELQLAQVTAAKK